MTAVDAHDLLVGGWERVSGGASYVADVRAPGALHMAFVSSTAPHARVRKVDLGPALAMPGVVDAISRAEIGDVLVGRALRDYPVLATDRVVFSGQRVAAVAATDRETALAAAGAVEIEYEPLPAVPDLEGAIAAETDVVHPGYDGYAGAVPGRPAPNLQGFWETSSGDPDRALTEHRVFDDEFVCARNHSGAMEPHACLVSATPDHVDVWATHKEPDNLRRLIAELAALPVDDVVVHPRPIGGDFGSKGFPFVEVACYLLAARTGRPVRHVMSYYEVLTSTSVRHLAKVRLRTAVADGRIVATEAVTTMDGGAFGGVKALPTVVVPVMGVPLATYGLTARRDRCVSYYTNTVPGGHVRSPGEHATLFASESQVDVIAAALGADPLEFRLANAADERVRGVLEEMRPTVERWRTECPPGAGVGLALCFCDAGPGRTAVRCVASPDGVEVLVSVADPGAGSYTVFRRLAAEALAVPESAVRIRAVGVDPGLRDTGAGAGRVTAVAGRAVVTACEGVARRLAGVPDTPRGYWIGDRLAELGLTSVEGEGEQLTARPRPEGVEVRSHGGIAIQLAVDIRTGQLTLQRALVVADTGRVLNPIGHRGQLEGGFVFGLSQALLEELVVEDGQVVTASLGDYRIATSADIPPLEVRVLEPGPALAGQILSAGELMNTGVAPAIANAISAATGARVRELPLTPDRVLAALRRGAGR